MKRLVCLICVTLFLASIGLTEVLAGDKTYEALSIKPPKIDGNLIDWPNLATEELAILASFNEPESPADLTAKFMAGYSMETNKLYIAIMVTDDSPYAAFPLEDGNSWKNDRVEIYIDGDYSAVDTNYSREVAQQYVVYGPADEAVKFEGGERLLYPPGGEEYIDPDFITGVKRTGTETIYEVELTVYETYNTVQATLNPGVTIGFDMAIVDNDDGNDDHSTFFSWSEGGSKYKDETAFGSMTFSSVTAAMNPAAKLATKWGSLKSSL